MGILVGINTVIADNPKLNCRMDEAELNDETDLLTYIQENNLAYAEGLKFMSRNRKAVNPVRIIVDSHLRVPLNSEVINDAGNTIIGTIRGCNESKKNELESMGIKVIETEPKQGKVDLKKLIEKLSEEGIDSILIEGGGNINFSALEEGIVDKAIFYIAPKIIGGEKTKNSIGGNGFLKLDDAVRLKDTSYRKINDDFVIEGYVDK